MIEKIGGRKFTYAILTTVMAFVGWMYGRIDSQQFLTFVNIMGVTYVAANVATQVVAKSPDEGSSESMTVKTG